MDARNSLSDSVTTDCVTAERALNRRLEGGCQVPIACFVEYSDENSLSLRALVGRIDGSQVLRVEQTGTADRADALGIQAAEALLNLGAGSILADVRQDS